MRNLTQSVKIQTLFSISIASDRVDWLFTPSSRSTMVIKWYNYRICASFYSISNTGRHFLHICFLASLQGVWWQFCCSCLLVLSQLKLSETSINWKTLHVGGLEKGVRQIFRVKIQLLCKVALQRCPFFLIWRSRTEEDNFQTAGRRHTSRPHQRWTLRGRASQTTGAPNSV